MTQAKLVSELLRASADGIAGFATSILYEAEPGGLGLNFAEWKSHMRSQVMYLATHVQESESDGFAEHMRWIRSTFEARSISVVVLDAALESLGRALQESLPDGYDQVLHPHLAAGRSALQSANPESPSFIQAFAPNGELAKEYLMHLLQGDESSASSTLVQKLEAGLEPQSIIEDVLVPSMREMGRLWHAGKATIAEEHFVSQAASKALVQVVAAAAKQPANGKTALLAAVSGDAHSFGIQSVAAHFEMAGWRTICLGCDVPASDLAQSVTLYHADVVLLSATLSILIPALEESVAAIQQTSPAAKIIIGGNGCTSYPALSGRLGVHGIAESGIEAVKLATQLLGA